MIRKTKISLFFAPCWGVSWTGSPYQSSCLMRLLHFTKKKLWPTNHVNSRNSSKFHDASWNALNNSVIMLHAWEHVSFQGSSYFFRDHVSRSQAQARLARLRRRHFSIFGPSPAANDPLVNVHIAIKTDHWNINLSHEKGWFSIVV